MHAWGLLMVGLIMSSHINIGIAGRTYALHQEQIHQQQQSQRQKTNDVSEYRSLQYLQVGNFSVMFSCSLGNFKLY